MNCQTCGAPTEEKTAACPSCGRAAAGELKFARADVLALKWLHAMAALVGTLMVAFWFAPGIRLEAGALSSLGEDYGAVNFSLGFPWGDQLRALVRIMPDKMLPLAVILEILAGVSVFLFDMVPFLISLYVICLPFFKKSLTKRRRLIFPRFVAGWALVKIFWWSSVPAAIAAFSPEGPAAARVTVGGWILLGLSLVWILLLNIIAHKNKQMHVLERVK